MEINLNIDLDDFVNKWSEDTTLVDEVTYEIRRELVRAIKSSPEYIQLQEKCMKSFREKMEGFIYDDIVK